MSQRLEIGTLAQEATQQLHLRAVGRDDAHVESLVNHALSSQPLEILLQRVDGELRLGAVDASVGLPHHFLVSLEVHLCCVDPCHGRVEVEDAAVFHLGSTLHFSVVEPVAREAHDVVVHAVLHLEQRYHLRIAVHDALHESACQSAFYRLQALDGGRQLTVVAGEDYSVCLADGYPARRLERLCRLVDEESGKLHSLQHTAGTAGESAGDYPRAVEELVVDAQLQLRLAAAQAVELLVIAVGASPLGAAQLAYRLANRPQLRIVGVRLKAALIGEPQHLVVDARGISHSQHLHAAVHQALANPVDRHVALSAHQHLVLAPQRLIDGLDQRGGLARAGRAMHHGDILSLQHLVDGMLLSGVEPGEAQGSKRELLSLAVVVEQVAQLCQAVALGGNHPVESLEHELIAALVHRELHPHALVALQLGNGAGAGHHYHHAALLSITHRALKLEISNLLAGVNPEKRHLAAILKVVLDVGVLAAAHLHHQLVERVVVAAPHGDGPPAVATLHLAPQPHRRGLVLEFLSLGFVLGLEQHALSLQF